MTFEELTEEKGLNLQCLLGVCVSWAWVRQDEYAVEVEEHWVLRKNKKHEC